MSSSQTQPKKWHEVYQGDAECKFFVELTRGKSTGESGWRTMKGLASSANLSNSTVQAIADKYLRNGILEAHTGEPDKIRYWEYGVTATKKPSMSIAQADREKQLTTAKGNPAPTQASGGIKAQSAGASKKP